MSMSKLAMSALATAFGLLVMTPASAAFVPKVQTHHIHNHVGEQHLHAALKHTHAAEQAERAKNTQAALQNAQAAIQALHAADQAFSHAHKASGNKATHHHHHTHIHAAIKDLTVAEKNISGGKIGKSEKEMHRAAQQIQTAIRDHAKHGKK